MRDGERLIFLKDVPNHLPENTRKPCYDTVLLWAKRGVRGVVLETTWVGGRRYTSIEALARFHGSITASHSTKAIPAGVDLESSERAYEKVMALIGGQR